MPLRQFFPRFTFTKKPELVDSTTLISAFSPSVVEASHRTATGSKRPSVWLMSKYVVDLLVRISNGGNGWRCFIFPHDVSLVNRLFLWRAPSAVGSRSHIGEEVSESLCIRFQPAGHKHECLYLHEFHRCAHLSSPPPDDYKCCCKCGNYPPSNQLPDSKSPKLIHLLDGLNLRLFVFSASRSLRMVANVREGRGRIVVSVQQFAVSAHKA